MSHKFTIKLRDNSTNEQQFYFHSMNALHPATVTVLEIVRGK